MPFHYPSFNKHLSFSKRDKSKLIRNRLRTESVDGSGNFKITKFIKTGKCSKFSNFVVKTQSSIEFSNSIFLHNILTRNCGKYFRAKARKHFILVLAKLTVSEHIAPLMRKNSGAQSHKHRLSNNMIRPLYLVKRQCNR